MGENNNCIDNNHRRNSESNNDDNNDSQNNDCININLDLSMNDNTNDSSLKDENKNENKNNIMESMKCIISSVPKGILRFSIRGLRSLEILGKVLQINDTHGTFSNKDKNENENVNKNVGENENKDRNGNENKNENENENFFRNVLSYQPVSRIWQENVLLGVNVNDVRRLTEYYRNNDKNNHESSSKNNDQNNNEENHRNNNEHVDRNMDSNFDKNVSRMNKLKMPLNASSSLLWSDKGRENSTKSFIKDHHLNADLRKKRQLSSQILKHKNDEIFSSTDSVQNDTKTLINNGNLLKTVDEITKIPILIIRKDLKNFSSKKLKNKNKKKSPFLGFDIILPPGWGGAVWRAFQFAGARAVGMEEMDSIQLDCGSASFPR